MTIKFKWREYREIRKALRASGVSVPLLRTLLRKRKVRRVAHGRYVVEA